MHTQDTIIYAYCITWAFECTLGCFCGCLICISLLPNTVCIAIYVVTVVVWFIYLQQTFPLPCCHTHFALLLFPQKFPHSLKYYTAEVDHCNSYIV